MISVVNVTEDIISCNFKCHTHGMALKRSHWIVPRLPECVGDYDIVDYCPPAEVVTCSHNVMGTVFEEDPIGNEFLLFLSFTDQSYTVPKYFFRGALQASVCRFGINQSENGVKE